MHYADTVGLAKVHAALVEYSDQFPEQEHLKPAALLAQLAESGQSLGEYWQS